MKCEKCSKEHDGSFGSGRFCSRSCANSRGKRSYETKKKISESLGGKNYAEIIVLEFCKICRKKLVNKQKIYCSKSCSTKGQNNDRYDEYIRKWKNNEVDGCKGKQYKNTSANIRKYLWEKYNGKCSRCGWDTPNPVTGRPVLEVEHIDGDHMNNKEENLDLICLNCHSLTPTYRALNMGNGRHYKRKEYLEKEFIKKHNMKWG